MTEHLSHDELTLVYYGEAPQNGNLNSNGHLKECDTCRREYETLAAVLDGIQRIPAPVRPADYADHVWSAIEARLPGPVPSQWRWRRYALPAAIAAMMLIAFQLGRYMPADQPRTEIVVVPENAAGRVLESALGSHLERSRRVLVELVNSADRERFDIALERQVAGDLLENNRLYRQTAAQVGESGVEQTLDDLERILLEIAHSPDTVPAETIQSLRTRIESLELLFRVRVLESQIRDRNNGVPGPESSL